MSILDSLKQRGNFVGPLLALFVIGLIVFNVWLFRHFFTTPPIPVSHKAYYSDDDGATWYIDDAFNVPPYIHNGKPAVLAYLYKCDDGKVFVQYLLKFPDAVKTTIQIEAKQGVDPEIAIDMARSNQALLKRPGDKEWLKTAGGMSSRMGEFIRIISARCPDGKPAIAVGIDEQAKP